MVGPRLRRVVVAAILGTALAALTSLPVSAEIFNFVATPARIPVGGTVTLSGVAVSEGPFNPGHAEACAPGGPVTLSSDAFAGQGPITAANSGQGPFRVQVTIHPQVKPGTYTITAVCGATAPPAQTTLVVFSPRLPATGVPSVHGPWLGEELRAAALVTGLLALLLLAATTAGRVRRVRSK